MSDTGSEPDLPAAEFPQGPGGPAAPAEVDPAAESQGAGGSGETTPSAEPAVGDEHPGSREAPGSAASAKSAEPAEPAEPGREDTPPTGHTDRPDLSEPATLRAAVESILFVADAPVTVTALAAGLQRPAPEIEAALATLRRELDERHSGVELREVADGVRLYTRPEFAGWIEAFLIDGQRVRLTQAALETLAVIAYRQPVTRARISAIRGVNVDGVVRTLITRGLITEVGADPVTGGGLYRTTELFLEKMGLRSIEELPSLAPLLPELTGLESDELSG